MTSDTRPLPFSHVALKAGLGWPGRRLESYTVITLVLLSSVEIKKGQLPLQLMTHTKLTHTSTQYLIILLHNESEYCTVLLWTKNIVKFSITLWGLVVGGSCVLYR